jgi:flagellar motor switch protein FliG
MEAEAIPGIKKAAILLLVMDDEMTKEIMKDLEEDEIEAIGQEITRLKLIPDHVVSKVMEEFTTKLGKRNKQVVGGEQKFKMLIKKSFSDEKAETFLGNIETKKGTPGEFLRRCDPKLLANVLRGEHPQTIALVLSTLGSKKAGDAISALPERIQTEVIMRMANLEKVDMSVLAEVESVIREQLENIGELLGKLEESSPDLAEKIRQLMFTFEDLVQLDDKSVQTLLKEISSEDIGLALKGASDAMKEKIYSNMSERASAMLKEDLEAMGPVRLSDVEKAQVKIAMIAKKLEGEGKIILSRGSEKFV